MQRTMQLTAPYIPRQRNRSSGYKVNTENDKLNGTDQREPSPVCQEPQRDSEQMDEPMATLNQDGQVERLSVTTPGEPQPSPNDRNESRRGSGMRFTYPSGSKPLDGYTIKRGIGIGGFGEVYFAISDAGKEVALKRIQRNVDVELRGVSQCLNLKHSNLITLWDIRQDEHGEGWVVMEYVPGPNLRDLIEDNPQGMSEAAAMNWFEAIAKGVAYLHDHGIVHRDLKPGNIFLDDGEQVLKIGDYGLSKFISCSRRSGQTESVGTFHYMAPEIGKGVYGKEIDVYALGIMLFEMLTGRVPFDGESSQEIIMKHLTADPKLDGVGRNFQLVIRKALAKDPDRRFRNVQEMLEAIQQGGPLSDQPSIEFDAADSPGHSGRGVDRGNHSGTGSNQHQIGPMFISDEPFFIGDDHEDIIMGDVQNVVLGEPIPADETSPVRSASRTTSAGAGNAPTSAGPVESTIEEPIARSLMGTWHRIVHSWNQSNMSTPVKVLLLVMIGFALLINVHWLLPLCAVIAVIYGLYYFTRSMILLRRRRAAKSDETKASETRKEKRELAEKQDRLLRKGIARKHANEKMMELSGSMLMSCVVVATLALLSMAIAGDSLRPTVDSLSFYAWLSMTGVFASWTLLSIGKFWHGERGDTLKRRFILLAGGLVVGAASYATSELLMVDMPAETRTSAVSTDLAVGFQDKQGTPLLPAYLLYFAGLFVVLRWWKQADPLRKTRLSVFSIGVCLLWACLLNEMCQFPLPWGILLAGTISFAVQIASPHLDKEDRKRIEVELQEA